MKDIDSKKEQIPFPFIHDESDQEERHSTQTDRKRFVDIVEFLPDATFVIDANRTVIAWNKAMETLTGVTKENIVGQRFPAYGMALYTKSRPMLVDLILSNENEKDNSLLYESFRWDGNAVYAESFVQSAFDGRGAYLWGKASPLYDKRGKVIGVIESIRDVTERKQTEDLYKTLVNDLQIGLYILLEGKIVFANQHIPRYSGYSMEELLGSEIIPYVHPDDRALVRKKAAQVLKGERSKPYEFRFIDKSGEVKWLMETVSSISHRGQSAVLGNTMDITELKEVKKEVERMKSLEASILSSVPHALFGVENRQIFFVNQSMETVFGWRPDELIGKKTRILFRNDEDYQEFGRIVYSELEDHDRFIRECEMPFIRKDGREIFCRLSVSRIGDRLEGTKRVVSTFEDITLSKLAKEVLRQSEERYRAIVEEQVELVSRWRPDKTLTFVNDAYCQFYGKTREELLGKPYDSNLPEDDLQRMKEHITQLSPQNPVASIEHRVYARNGAIRWTQWSDRVIPDREGNIAEIQSVGRDITEQKRIQEEYQIKDNAIKSSITPIIITDLDSKLTYANDAFLDLWGFETIDDVIGTQVCDYLLDSSATDRAIEHLGKDEGWVGELVARKKDGTTFDAQVTTSVVRGHNNTPIALMASFVDMTEKKQSDEAIRQLQKMEAIGTLAGGIAHDFNNILMGIQGHNTLMLLDVDTTHPFYDHLKRQETIVASGARLSRQLLGFARGGKYEVALVDLNDIIIKSLEMFGRTKKEISIEYDLHPDIWKVEADQGQIEQVLLNLFVNAWQAMPGGGQINVETGNEVLSGDFQTSLRVKHGKYVRISVTDTGIGMDEETRQRIFEPFFTTKERAHGTGLGLASVYGIVKNHGGFITVESEKGKGSTFTIYLPALLGELKRDNEDKEQKIARGTETVLIIDDEEMILDIGVTLLEELGYTVLKASDGREALALFEENREKIDLVILDMIMPGMGGREVFERLKDIKRDVKVLLSSGYSNNGEASELMNKGCDGFIQKPFSIANFSGIIREILDSR
jgi:PAS domain S-box-containing protein